MCRRVTPTLMLCKTPIICTFPCSSVNGFHDVNQLLLVIHGPVYLVVVAGAQIDHHVLVPRGKKEKRSQEHA